MTNQASYGQNNVPDANTQTGWTVQGTIQVPSGVSNGEVTTTAATTPAGYAQAVPGGLPPTASPAQSGSGTAYPPVNQGSNATSSTNTEPILDNAGYAQPGVLRGGAYAVSPIPASGTAFTNPLPTLTMLTVSGGTVSVVAVAPYGSTTFTTIGTGDGSYNIPGGSQVKLTYSVVPTTVSFTVAA